MPPTYRAKAEHWRDQQRKLVKWLGSLPKPIGLFAVTDYRARQVLDACRQEGVRVPQQVAVIGVDNEEVICMHGEPKLSSVARNNQQEGYHAAAMLDQLMRGKNVSTVEEMIPPLGVVARESTETVAFKDARLCEAIDYLNKHIDDPIGVQELASHVGVSRRWMEYAFRDALGESPYQYIRHRRLKLAQHLLGRGIGDEDLRGRAADRLHLGQAALDGVLPGVWREPARLSAEEEWVNPRRQGFARRIFSRLIRSQFAGFRGILSLTTGMRLSRWPQ